MCTGPAEQSALGADGGTDKDLGRENRAVVQEMLISLSLRPLLHHGRMPVDRYQALIAGAVRELHDDSLKLYYRL